MRSRIFCPRVASMRVLTFCETFPMVKVSPVRPEAAIQ
jgi:hypothetical protein